MVVNPFPPSPYASFLCKKTSEENFLKHFFAKRKFVLKKRKKSY